MKTIEYYKYQLTEKYDLIDSAIMKEYYNLSRFLNHSNIEDHEISDHIVNKINTLSNEKIELINEAASLLKETLKVVIPSLENTFSDTQHLEIIMIVGEGYIDGHGVIVSNKPYVIIDLGTIAESLHEYDLEVFLIHEIIHALHYNVCPSMYFRNYSGLADDYIKRLVSEGIATYATGRLHSKESGFEYWLGHFTVKETNEWIDLCERRKCEVSERLSSAIKLNQIDRELYYKLFSVFDPDNLMDSRTAYYYGSKVCESLAKNINLRTILEVSADEWYNATFEYFGLSGLIKDKTIVLDIENALRIRKATSDDCESIAQICESNASLYDPIMPGAFNKQAEKFRSNGLPSTYNILVIESENQILGFLGTIECNEKSLYLVAIYLHQSHQRSGIGSIILEELVRNYRSAGYDEIVLLVHKEAVWAKSFYLKNQFKYVSSSELDIKSYGNGILSNLYIPNTELLSLSL